jgi:hypothetical protein
MARVEKSEIVDGDPESVSEPPALLQSLTVQAQETALNVLAWLGTLPESSDNTLGSPSAGGRDAVATYPTWWPASCSEPEGGRAYRSVSQGEDNQTTPDADTPNNPTEGLNLL